MVAKNSLSLDPVMAILFGFLGRTQSSHVRKEPTQPTCTSSDRMVSSLISATNRPILGSQDDVIAFGK